MQLTAERLAALLPAVVDVAIAAAREIMRIDAAGFSVTLKHDRSPLTEADLASQRVIAAGLAALDSDIPMLAEESAPAVFAQRRQWHTLWLVDPLDGTREFVKGNGEFAVNIALVCGHEPVLGVIAAPARGHAYGGARGVGAHRYESDGTRRAIHVQERAAQPLRILGSRSHGDRVLDRMLERLGAQQRIRLGSALKFGLLAEGGGDLYVRRGATSEWDTAAGHALLLEAGGAVVDLSGEALQYNARTSLTNPSFIAYADRTRDWVGALSEPVARPIV